MESYQSSETVKRIVWTCSVCDRDIHDQQGFVGAAYLDAMLTPEGGVRWKVLHGRCALDPNAYYYIDVDELRVEAGVTSWTRHLNSKTWVHQSDWAEIAHGAISRAAW